LGGREEGVAHAFGIKLRILRSALDDLAAGRGFYDRREKGVGDYFYDSLFAEIDSLVLYAGIHPIRFGFHRLLARRFITLLFIRA
jgi:hypothetical protein